MARDYRWAGYGVQQDLFRPMFRLRWFGGQNNPR